MNAIAAITPRDLSGTSPFSEAVDASPSGSGRFSPRGVRWLDQGLWKGLSSQGSFSFMHPQFSDTQHHHVYISNVRVFGLTYSSISRLPTNEASDNKIFERCFAIPSWLLFNTTESLGLLGLIRLISRQGILDTPFLAPQ